MPQNGAIALLSIILLYLENVDKSLLFFLAPIVVTLFRIVFV